MMVLLFQGFDPLYMRELVKKRCELPLIAQAVGLFLHRGTNLDKIKRTIPDEGLQNIKLMEGKIGLVGTGVPLKRDTVTLSRLASCYPDVVVSLLSKNEEVLQDRLLKEFPEIPTVMKTNSFASVIPTNLGDLTVNLLKLHLIVMIKFNQIFNPLKETEVDEVKKYQMAAFKSAILNDERRLQWLIKIEIVTIDDEGTPNLTKKVQDALSHHKIAYEHKSSPEVETGNPSLELIDAVVNDESFVKEMRELIQELNEMN